MNHGRRGSINAQNKGAGLGTQLEQYALYQGGTQVWGVLQKLIETVNEQGLSIEEQGQQMLEVFGALFTQVVSLSIAFGLFKLTASLMDFPGGAFIASLVSSAGGYAVSTGVQGYTGLFA